MQLLLHVLCSLYIYRESGCVGGVCNVNYAAVSGTELMIEHWNLVNM